MVDDKPSPSPSSRCPKCVELEARCEFWEGQYRLAEDSRLELARLIRVCDSSLADACIYLPGLKEIIERIEQENESLHARCKDLTEQSLRRLSGLAKCGIERDELRARCKGMEDALRGAQRHHLDSENGSMYPAGLTGKWVLWSDVIAALTTIPLASPERSDAPSPAKEKVAAEDDGRPKTICTICGETGFCVHKDKFRKLVADTSPALPAEVHPIEPAESPSMQDWDYKITQTSPRFIVRGTRPGQERFWKWLPNIWYTSESLSGPWYWSEDAPPGVKSLLDSPPPSTPNGSGSSDNSQTKGANS